MRRKRADSMNLNRESMCGQLHGNPYIGCKFATDKVHNLKKINLMRVPVETVRYSWDDVVIRIV
jgi:hypothetical protein